MEDLETKINGLECPFIWKLPKVPLERVSSFFFKTQDTFNAELKFTRYLLSAYVEVINSEYEKAIQDLTDMQQIVAEMKSPIQQKVAGYILNATKAHFHLKNGNLDEVEKILENIDKIDDDTIYLSALNQFKASIWRNCSKEKLVLETAKNFANVSIKHDPQNATAHYILAKCIRKLRRLVSIFAFPEADEIFHFRKAYDLEKYPRFGLAVALSYKENKHFDKSFKMFKEIYEMKVNDSFLQLKLALAFMQVPKSDKEKHLQCLHYAQNCFDFIESASPEETKTSIFSYYKGLFFMKKENFKEASDILLKSIRLDDANYGAEMTYIHCRTFLEEPFDYISYFLQLRCKYSDTSDARRKEILLNIAFCYFYIEENFEEAIKYFLLAFEIDEDRFSLKSFRVVVTTKWIDVYYFLEKEFFPEIEIYIRSPGITVAEETISAFEKLKKVFDRPRQGNFIYQRNVRSR